MSLWPLRPNWRSPYTETYAFLTEVIESDSGREQRRAQRVLARHSVEYQAMAARDLMRAQRRVGVALSDPMIFADEVRRARTAAPTAVDGNSVTLTTAPGWPTSAKHVVFERPGTNVRRAYAITALTGDLLTVSAAFAEVWPAGTQVYLGLPGRLEPSQTTVFRTSTVAEGAVSWMVEPGQEVQPVGGAPVTFNDREVMLHRPNWATPIEFETNDPITYVDPGMGVRSAYRRQTFVPEGRKSQHLSRSVVELNQTLGVFLRARGRQGAFYQPTMVDDLPLMQTVNAGSAFWRTPGHAVDDAFGDSFVHRAIAVMLLNGDVHLFQVAGLSKGGTTAPYTQIETLTSAPIQITPAMVDRICWMPVVRFASDELSVRWQTDTIAEITINTLTLEDRS